MPRKNAAIKPSCGAYAVKRHAEVAAWFGLQLDAIRNWAQSGMPGRRGYYPLDEITRWRLTTTNTEPELDSEAKARLAEIKARSAEIDLRVKERAYVPVHGLRDGLDLLSATLVRCAETLQRDCGREAMEIMRDHIEEFETQVDGLLKEWGIDRDKADKADR